MREAWETEFIMGIIFIRILRVKTLLGWTRQATNLRKSITSVGSSIVPYGVTSAKIALFGRTPLKHFGVGTLKGDAKNFFNQKRLKINILLARFFFAYIVPPIKNFMAK